ncbi:MAG TPA: TetR/AcrR family transcriptional regulator [Alphaproteobacteria bacterium]|nr:TetR/AcrR family transcriptional regulator [Alphaproteobacteria bacterium]
MVVMRERPRKRRRVPKGEIRGARGGRPSRVEAERLSDRILEVATEMFIGHGYSATSIEAIASAARIGKLTLYRRFSDKAALFGEVVHRMIERWKNTVADLAEADGELNEVLERTAARLLDIVLSPEAISLYRIVTAEAVRFPALAHLLHRQGDTRNGNPVVALLRRQSEQGVLKVEDPNFAAEQFIQMVIGEPRRRLLLGLPAPSGRESRERVRKSVDLFLNGCRSS